MKKKLFKSVLVIIALSLQVNAFAQKDATIDAAIKMTNGGKFLDTNYKITKPLTAALVKGQKVPANASKHKVNFEIMNFGSDGNTVLITLDLGEEGIFTASWSGKNVHVLPGYDSGMGMLGVLRGSNICGTVGVQKGEWYAIVNMDSNLGTIGNLKKGMTRSEVENVACGELNMSQFKFTRNSGNLKVYSLFWLGQNKQYNFFGTDYHYELRNDKKYGDFYFDAQGKLVKWLFFM